MAYWVKYRDASTDMLEYLCFKATDMSYSIGHFGLGAGLTAGLLAGTKLHKSVKRDEGIAIVGGLWGMAPDISKIIPALKTFHNSWWADLFWFHHIIDAWIDPTDSYYVSSGFLLFMIIMLTVLWYVDR